MKKIFTILVLSFSMIFTSMIMNAENVKLTYCYWGSPAEDCTVQKDYINIFYY